jgi:signal transduction histidine kinase
VRPSPDRLLDHREFPVLYVDDERENLRIFELSFKRDFSVVTATSGEQGLAILNERPIAVVLSDHRMPGMTGVEFLTRAREIDPKTVRILVTAYGDAETLSGAINNGSIYRFVPKPWSQEEMRVTIRRAIEVYALDRERDQLVRELSLLNRVGRAINQELALGALLDLLMETVVGEMSYDGAGILFFDARREKLRWAALAPKDSPVTERLRDLEIRCASAPGFVGRILAGEVQTLGVGQALSLEGSLRRWVTEVAAEQILVVPLLGRDGALGALVVDNRRGGRAFGADDETLLGGLATQAAIAIQNARLVEDLRRSREQVLRADRLGTLGTLAAGLAHEINNPLVSIHTFLSMAPGKRHEDDPEFWGDYHALASSEVDRIRRLVDTMRRLGRDSGPQAPRQSFDPAELAREVVTLLQREAGRAHVSLALEADPSTPKIVAVRDQIHQVLLNLLLNAVYVTGEGGEVRVRVGPEPDGEGVWLEVCDEGPGIPEEHLERIFDPFFTTKDPDQGSGLGLMICHRLIEDHAGSIEVRSAEAGGTTFCVRLPVGSDLAPGVAAA